MSPSPLTLLKRSHPHSYLTNAGRQKQRITNDQPTAYDQKLKGLRWNHSAWPQSPRFVHPRKQNLRTIPQIMALWFKPCDSSDSWVQVGNICWLHCTIYPSSTSPKWKPVRHPQLPSLKRSSSPEQSESDSSLYCASAIKDAIYLCFQKVICRLQGLTKTEQKGKDKTFFKSFGARDWRTSCWYTWVAIYTHDLPKVFLEGWLPFILGVNFLLH